METSNAYEKWHQIVGTAGLLLIFSVAWIHTALVIVWHRVLRKT